MRSAPVSRPFPDPDDPHLIPFTRAFVRMMFAHAEFEHRVSDLVSVIARCHGFGEKPENRWPARARPGKVKQLVAEHRGGLPEVDNITDYLQRSIALCDQRNLLAHGTWWELDVEAGLITVRSGTTRPGEEQHRQFTIDEIQRVADALGDLEVELYKIQRAIQVCDPPLASDPS
jgi:hypothetical protein